MQEAHATDNPVQVGRNQVLDFGGSSNSVSVDRELVLLGYIECVTEACTGKCCLLLSTAACHACKLATLEQYIYISGQFQVAS